MRSAFLAAILAILAGCTVAPPTPVSLTGASTITGTVSVNDQTPKTPDSLEVAVPSSAMPIRTTVSGSIIREVEKRSGTLLTIYDDYGCTYCRQFGLSDLPWIEQTYVATGMVRIERIFLPMSVLGTVMAKVAVCASEQSLFAETDRALHEKPLVSEAEIPAFAKKGKLNLKLLQTCMKAESTSLTLKTMEENARTGNVERVPTFRLDNEQWVGILTRDKLQKKIEEAIGL